MKLTIDSLSDVSKDFFNDVNEIINNSLIHSGINEINKILSYQLKIKGHMLRPFMIYLTAKCLKQDLSSSELSSLANYAAAVELLHNASLIHDDVLDSEIKRRGHDCLYRVYGEKNAILAGNVYYISAFQLVHNHLSSKQLTSITTAASNMCLGEMLQQEFIDHNLPVGIYLEIINKKTASLISESCYQAALLCEMNVEIADTCRHLGNYIGTIYQLKDDLIDMDADIEEGFDGSEYIDELIQKAVNIIDSFPNKEYNELFKNFINLILEK